MIAFKQDRSSVLCEAPKRQSDEISSNSSIDANRFQTRIISPKDTASLRKCFHLRHRYFVEERGWVVCSSDSPFQESDRYDSLAVHLAVLDKSDAVAYMRVLPWQPLGFMLTNEFRCLLPSDFSPPSRQSAEISRLVVSSDLNQMETVAALEALFQLFYHFALRQDFKDFFIVTEKCWLRACRRKFGFQFTPLGPAQIFPDGTRTVAAHASLTDLERSMQEYSMEKFQWYAALDAFTEIT